MLDDRPIPTLDDRNARSWRVPNDPSPKAKLKIAPDGEAAPNSNGKASASSMKRTGRSAAAASAAYSETSSDAQTDTGPFRNKLRSRMWKLLFNNVDRSVDELYYFCEDENDHQKILDAVLKLRRCLTDFEKLSTRSDEQRRFEEGGMSVSWDVRKTSIGVRRSQIVEVHEEYAPVDGTEPLCREDKSPTRKEKQAIDDLKTSEAKSRLNILAEPFVPRNSVTAVESLLKIDFGPPSEQVGTLPENASSTSKIKPVQMDKSRSMSLNPDIREVPVVSSPMKAVELAANASILVATAPTVVPKYSIATAKVLHTPPANQLNSKVAPIIIVAPVSTAKTGSKNPKKPTPTAGIGRSRASSESRLNLKNHAEEEDRVVTEEMEKATNAVWAEAEAWIEREFLAEEIAWKQLENVSETFRELPPVRKDNFNSIYDRMGEELEKIGNYMGGEEAHISQMDNRFTTPPPPDMNDADSVVNKAATKMVTRAVNTSFTEADVIDSKTLSSPSDASPWGHSPSQKYTSLHDKLSSPERRKLTPAEARQRLDERLLLAENNRSKSVSEIKEKAMAQSTRVKEVGIRTTERLMQAELSYAEKLRGAEKRHDDYIKNIKDKAGNENAKVSEVLFINSFNEMVLKDELNARLNEVEKKILAGRHRKEQLLQGIQDQRRKRNNRKAEQMSEMRFNLERQKMERWEALQLRLKTVQDRRHARLEEMQRRGNEDFSTANVEIVKHSTKSSSVDTVIGSQPFEIGPEVVVPTALVAPDFVMETMEPLNVEIETAKVKRVKRKKKIKTSGGDLDHLDDDVILELLPHPAKDNDRAEAELLDWKFQLLSSSLCQVASCSTNEAASKQRDMVSFFFEAAGRAAVGNMDPFTLSSKIVSKPGKELNGITDKVHLFVEMQAALSAIASAAKNKKKKAKSSTAVVNADSGVKLAKQYSRSCLQYKSDEFVSAMTDYIRRGLHIQDTAGLTLGYFTSVEVAHTPDADIIHGFINAGGLLVCTVSLHQSVGLLCNEHSLRLGFEENLVRGNDLHKKCCLALIAVQAIEWCCQSDPNNIKSLTKAPELVECLVDFSIVLLRAFTSWHNNVDNRSVASEFNLNRRKTSVDASARIPVKDPSQPLTPQKNSAPSRKISSADGLSKGGASVTDTTPCSTLPDYICIILPLMSSLNSIIAAATVVAIENEIHAGQLITSKWIIYLLRSNLLRCANDAMRDLDAYTDLCNGSTTMFHSIIYEVAALVKCISKLVTRVRCSSVPSDNVMQTLTRETVIFMQQDETSMASNLVQVLSSLLLRDLSTIRHPVSSDHTHTAKPSVGADKGTGVSSIGSGWDKSQALPPPQVLHCSFLLLEALNAVAVLDILFVQTIPEVLKVSLVHTSSLLLVILFQIIEDRHLKDRQNLDSSRLERRNYAIKGTYSKTRQGGKPSYGRPVGWCPSVVGPGEATLGLCPLFVFLGYFCLKNADNQAAVVRGTPPSLLLRLCRMPIRYLTDERLKHQILPTLIAMCSNNRVNIAVLHSELSPTLLTDYLKRFIDKDRSLPTSDAGLDSSFVGGIDSFDPVKELKERIPSSMWPVLIEQLLV